MRVLHFALLLAGCATAQPAQEEIPPFDLAFLENDGTTAQVVCLDLATGTTRPLTSGDSSVYAPRWVPDLDGLVVASRETTPTSLVRIDPATGERNILGINPADDEAPDWFSRSRAVYSVPSESGRALVIDGGSPSHPIIWLTRGRHTDKQPVFSPDGQRIAFVSDRSGTEDIWTLDLATDSLRRVTDGAAFYGHPAWHPDGRALVVYRFADGDADLQRLDLATDALTPLAPAPGFDLVARFSPDGRWLAFGSARSDDWEVYLARADGSDIRRLTAREGFDGDAIWLPDGTCRP